MSVKEEWNRQRTQEGSGCEKKDKGKEVWSVLLMKKHEINTPIIRCWEYVTSEYLLTYSLHGAESFLSTNRFAASQEIPHISRNPKVHYRTHNRPPPVSILGQPNPVHISTSQILDIHPKIIHPSTPRSPHWPLSLRFPHQDPLHPLLLTHTRHMPSPSHSKEWIKKGNKNGAEISDSAIWLAKCLFRPRVPT